MHTSELLKKLDLGSPVAEFDQMLDRHFVITKAFQDLIAGKVDVVAGDKGAGKTTIYKYLQQKCTAIPELKKVEILAGFNPSGSPIFKRLVQLTPYTEAQYLSFWKTYILSLVGNWLLNEGGSGRRTQELSSLLGRIGIRTKDGSVETVFTRLSKMFHRLMNPSSLAESRINDAAITEILEDQIVDHDEALSLLNASLHENDITIWVLLDRLDEAFIGYPEIEQSALRALFRVHLDLRAFDRIALKLFVRKDLFRKIMQGGFVNLTHVSARKVEIIWDHEDLFALLCRRIRASEEFLELLDLNSPTDQEIFTIVLPARVSMRKTTWNWMLSQIKDGSGFVAPRNLIELVNLAIEEQTRSASRTACTYQKGTPLIEIKSLEQALVRLSDRRVEDTLLAEATNDVAVLIGGFRGLSAEHSDETIARIFSVPITKAKDFAEVLINIGFFERGAKGYTIPLLYRGGLTIKSKGKKLGSLL